MKPGQVDLPIIWRGCNWPAVTLHWKDRNGLPINLTDWFPVAWTNQFDLHALVTDPAEGVATMSLQTEDTANLRLGVHRWNWIFKNISSGEVVQPLLAGTVEVKSPTLLESP